MSEQEQIDTAALVHTSAQIQFSSPLPPPQVLQGYGNIDETYPERIFKDFETNSAHVREQEKIALQAQIADAKRGQWMSFLLILIGISATVFMTLQDKDAAAIGAALTTATMIYKGLSTGK